MPGAALMWGGCHAGDAQGCATTWPCMHSSAGSRAWGHSLCTEIERLWEPHAQVRRQRPDCSARHYRERTRMDTEMADMTRPSIRVITITVILKLQSWVVELKK